MGEEHHPLMGPRDELPLFRKPVRDVVRQVSGLPQLFDMSLRDGGLLRESWIRGVSDSRTIPSAGLLDYEDTRLKTSSRVRKGLSLAWKASLAIQI